MSDREKNNYSGIVKRRAFAKGSKSEHDAIHIQTDSDLLRLRRRGGPAMDDKVLEQLVGKKIVCSGRRRGGTLLITDWEEEGESEKR